MHTSSKGVDDTFSVLATHTRPSCAWQLTERIKSKEVMSLDGSRASSVTLSNVLNRCVSHRIFASPICSTWNTPWPKLSSWEATWNVDVLLPLVLKTRLLTAAFYTGEGYDSNHPSAAKDALNSVCSYSTSPSTRQPLTILPHIHAVPSK